MKILPCNIKNCRSRSAEAACHLLQQQQCCSIAAGLPKATQHGVKHSYQQHLQTRSILIIQQVTSGKLALHHHTKLSQHLHFASFSSLPWLPLLPPYASPLLLPCCSAITMCHSSIAADCQLLQEQHLCCQCVQTMHITLHQAPSTAARPTEPGNTVTAAASL